jgi:fused signal recognition particle receptor
MSDPSTEGKKSWFGRLTQGLKKTSQALTQGITGLFTKRKLDAETLEGLEELLIRADMGVDNAAAITASLRSGRFDKEISDEEIRTLLCADITARLTPHAVPFAPDPAIKPFVTLVIGVNGSGKTTTIGKLAQRLSAQGKRVMVVAGDTFRAAAVEQLKIWAQRTGADIISGAEGADPAGLVFDALVQAETSNVDVVLIDTAGRLQNKAGLMAELEKIVRVIKKRNPAQPQATLLVLDATVGQNAIPQVDIFSKAAGVTGLVMTKLDGTAKGGILVALAAKFALPIHMIGVGEGADDLQDFNAQEFASALVGLTPDAS